MRAHTWFLEELIYILKRTKKEEMYTNLYEADIYGERGSS